MPPPRTLVVLFLAFFLAVGSLGIMHLRESTPVGSTGYWLSPAQSQEPTRALLEFLLLLPVAVTIVGFFRVVIGVSTFGTFAPALLGLAYRDIDSPIGVLVLLTVLFAGWFLRHLVNRLHLLQVPRTSFMLSLVVGMLVGFVLIGERLGLPVEQSIPLFPLVILTGMIERFWALDEEQGTASTLRTLLVTLGLCAGISLLLRWPWVADQMMHYPETLGIVMAVQLLLGRYTGYRIVELYRFRTLMGEDNPCFGFSVRGG